MAATQQLWFPGTELLHRKWTKNDEIEYDSDRPEHVDKYKDGRSHVHKGVILTIAGGHFGFGKLMVRNEFGGYVSYPLKHIRVKLPPRNTGMSFPVRSIDIHTNAYVSRVCSWNTAEIQRRQWQRAAKGKQTPENVEQ